MNPIPPSHAPRSGGAADQYRLLVESVKDYAIFILDPGGHVTTWNEGARRIKGYSAEEIIGKHFSVFYPAEDVAAGKCERELEIARQDGRFEEEGWRLHKSGTRLWASITITALRTEEGELVGFAKVTRDLTERAQLEERRRVLAAEEAAVAERARIQEFQERFLAILGHDLRNPLAAIDMGASLVRQMTESDTPMSRVADRMRSSARRMSRMIEQILDLTRSRLTGGLEVARLPMELCAMLTGILEELRAVHPGRNIELARAGPIQGRWDRDRLEQVFSNLVGNALHYGDKDTAVSVDACVDGADVHIDVHNHGEPIPEPLRACLFDPFRRGERDSRSKETEGLGLGLYISREIVLAHGGDLQVRSTRSEGTTFRVTLPTGAAPST